MNSPKLTRILINALSGIGDALMFTPALVKIKEALPDSKIEVLVMYKGVKEIYERIPEADNVIYFDFLEQGIFKSLKFIFSLRGKYDSSINVCPSNRKEYNIINRIIGAKKRAGIRYLRNDFSNLGFLNNLTVKENDDLHNVEENIRMAELVLDQKITDIPPLKIVLNDEDETYSVNYLQQKNITPGEFVVGFHAGCSTLKNHEKRRWETEKFAELAKRIIEKYNAKILLFGGPEESGIKEKIISLASSENIVSVETQSLMQSNAVMKRCNLFVTNDSGLMHIAAALQLKVVAVIGPTSLNYIHPWQTEYKTATLNLECAPCFIYSPKPLTCTRKDVQFKCIKELDVELVFGKVKEFLEK
ncbi:MAG: glycosyltransferase family 9 protein [bacterium]